MAICHCDGPPHTYDLAWCGEGKGDDGLPIIRVFNPGYPFTEALARLTGASSTHSDALISARLAERERQERNARLKHFAESTRRTSWLAEEPCRARHCQQHTRR